MEQDWGTYTRLFLKANSSMRRPRAMRSVNKLLA